MKYDYVIVGAGFFGSVCARELKDKGKKVLVVEKRAHVGGNCYTEDVEGIRVHRYGAHVFHTSDRKVWEYVNRFAEFNNYINSPLADYRGEIYNLPFNMNTFHALWGVRTPAEAEAKLARQRPALSGEPKNLEEQALRLAGRDIYEKFIKGYTEKQWGRDAKELPAFIIRRIPLRFTYDNNYFSDRYQGIPIGGYTPLFGKLLDGIEVECGVDFLKDRGRYLSVADKILFTGPIDEYFDKELGALEYRSLRFETERLEVENFQGNAVINYTAREIPYTRVIEHKHFEKGAKDAQPFTIVTREYPAEYRPGNEPCYPVNDEKNNRLYERYLALAAGEKKVIFGGRLGKYKYLDMDKTIAEAMKLSEEL